MSHHARPGIATAWTRSAFTLIELLVVISIIAILAGMLLPAISAVKGSADAAACGNSLRQLGLSVSAYAEQYDGIFMPANVGINGSIPWMELAHEFIDPDTHLGTQAGLARISRRGPIWGCPVWQRQMDPTYSNWETGYGINYNPWRDGTGPNYTRHTNLDPNMGTGERLPLGRAGHASARAAFSETGRNTWSIPAANVTQIAQRHRQNVNVCYLDGHVGAISATAVCTAVNNP